jgi:regulatory protein
MDDFQPALERAMKLLAVRARSRRELSERLLSLGFGPVAVEKVDFRLAELGLVDDVEYALERVRHLLSRGRSVGAMKQDLASRGVAEEVIDSSFGSFHSEGADRDRAVALAQRRAAACGNLPADKAFARVARYLCSKGYGPEVAEDACRQVFEGASEDPPRSRND